jgi:hypothetical protein
MVAGMVFAHMLKIADAWVYACKQNIYIHTGIARTCTKVIREE